MEEGNKITTRSRERKRKAEEGIIDEPKPKIQTLGQYLFDEREKLTEQLLTQPLVSNYEQFHNYEKDTVLEAFHATKVELFQNQLYEASEEQNKLKLVFLTLQTGPNPKSYTHLCNNSSLRWNLENLNISTSDYHFTVPNVVLLFVRGAHVEGTSLNSHTYKCLGLTGIQSTSSDLKYLAQRFVFDYVLSRKELETYFGANCLRCKKNKYGYSLCA